MQMKTMSRAGWGARLFNVYFTQNWAACRCMHKFYALPLSMRFKRTAINLKKTLAQEYYGKSNRVASRVLRQYIIFETVVMKRAENERNYPSDKKTATSKKQKDWYKRAWAFVC